MKQIYLCFFIAFLNFFLLSEVKAQNAMEQNKTQTIKKYIEKWEIVSSKPVNPSGLDNTYKLANGAYFIFVDPFTVVVKLNANLPEQTGAFTQSPLSIDISFKNEENCNNCIKTISMKRASTNDTEFRMTINGANEQLFSNKTFKN